MTYEILTKAGVDVDGLLKRLMGNGSLVRVFIKKFTEDTTIVRLRTAFAQEDMNHPNTASHTLKGMCGNLSLTAMYGTFTEQVALIRAGEYAKAKSMMPLIDRAYESALSHMRQWLALA